MYFLRTTLFLLITSQICYSKPTDDDKIKNIAETNKMGNLNTNMNTNINTNTSNDDAEIEPDLSRIDSGDQNQNSKNSLRTNSLTAP